MHAVPQAWSFVNSYSLDSVARIVMLCQAAISRSRGLVIMIVPLCALMLNNLFKYLLWTIEYLHPKGRKNYETFVDTEHKMSLLKHKLLSVKKRELC